jgi:hypothetical protein
MHLDIAPDSLDPALSADYIASFVASVIYEPLVRIGPDGRLIPAAVSRIHVDHGTRILRMHIDPMPWSDGRPLTAHDVLWSWQRLESMGPGSRRSLLALLIGSTPVEQAVRVTDPLTVEVRLRAGGHGFLPVLASTALAPVRDAEQPWRITLGPFSAADAPTGPDDGLELTANRHRPRTGQPVDRIRMEVVTDPDESLDIWLAGGCDATCNTMFPFSRAGDARPHLMSGPLPLIGVVTVNDSLRQRAGIDMAALNAAIPRDDIASRLHGGVEPLRSYWPGGPASTVASSARTRPGTPFDGPALRLAVADFYPNVAVCTSVVAAWRSIGVPVEIDVVDYRSLGRTAETHDFTYRILALPYPKEESVLLPVDLRRLGAGAEVIRARQAVVTRGGDAELLTAGFDALAPYFPVLRLRSLTAVSPRLTGLTIDHLGFPDFSRLEFAMTVPGGRRG